MLDCEDWISAPQRRFADSSGLATEPCDCLDEIPAKEVSVTFKPCCEDDYKFFREFCAILNREEKNMPNPPQSPVPIYEEASYATNPKDALGVRKVPFSTLSGPVLAAMGNAMLEGALKYGRHNYRVIGVKASVYFDAMNRHIWAWWEGEDIDPVSGKSHLVKAMTCLLVLIDAKFRGKMVDDRPPKSLGFIEEECRDTEELLEKFPNPVAPFTEKPI